MAALNMSETEALRNIMRLLEYINKHGYDPKDKAQNDLGEALRNSKKLINTVVQVKGYYPK